MPAQKQEDPPRTDPEKKANPQINASVSEQVLHLLGHPGSLHSVQVRKVWDDHYRVNIFIGVDSASATIAHSYFLVTDAGGKIIASTPKLSKQY